MSDIKQALLDELKEKKDFFLLGAAAPHQNIYDLIKGYIVADCIRVVDERLEGMAIVNKNDMKATIENLESSILHESDIDIGVYLAGLKLMVIKGQS